MSEKRFILDDWYLIDAENQNILGYDVSSDLVDLLNSLSEENEQLRKERDYWKAKYDEGTETFESTLAEENEKLKNELKKEKLLLEYSDSMYNTDLIVNIRFSNGEWKADVSVIDDE